MPDYDVEPIYTDGYYNQNYRLYAPQIVFTGFVSNEGGINWSQLEGGATPLFAPLSNELGFGAYVQNVGQVFEWYGNGIVGGAVATYEWAANNPEDAGHLALDLLGMIPVVGSVFDVANGGVALLNRPGLRNDGRFSGATGGRFGPPVIPLSAARNSNSLTRPALASQSPRQWHPAG